MKDKILTGSGCIDSNLGGGLSPDSVTLIYGEAETGKTTLAMQCAVNCALQGCKTLFVDCDNTFSAERFSKVASEKFDEIADRIILMKPKNFREQTALIDCTAEYTAKNFGLIVIDTFNSLYRAEVAKSSGKCFGLNRELNRQLAILAQIAKTQKTPVVITSQVRSVLDEAYVCVAPVANRVLTFWAEIILAMKLTENAQIIKVVIEKTGDITQEIVCFLRIEETGIRDYPFQQ